jgi:hypothetical protein
VGETIAMIVRAEPEDEDTKSIFMPDAEAVLEEVPVDKLRANLKSISESLSALFRDIKQVGAMQLKEVTVAVEVSASGGVSLIGTVNVGGKGAITLKFTG